MKIMYDKYAEENMQFEFQKINKEMKEEVQGEIQLFEVIPTKELSLEILTAKNIMAGKLNYLDIYVSYQWLKLPNFTKTDSQMVNWDNTVFTLKANSFYSKDWCYDKYHSSNKRTFTEYSSPSIINQGGIGWYTKLTKNTSDMLYPIHCGYTKFTLLPKSPIYVRGTNTHTTSIATNYTHNYDIFKASFSFTKNQFGVAINASNSSSYLAKNTNFYYSLK